MKNIFVKLTSVLLLTLPWAGIKAQEAVVATGGTSSGSGGTISYSAGQPEYTSFSGTSGFVNQGVQQVFEISEVSGNEQNKLLLFQIFPNPVSSYLVLHTDESENLEISETEYQLYDIAGNLVASRKIQSNETLLDMAGLNASAYILKIVKNNEVIKVFKIIKR